MATWDRLDGARGALATAVLALLCLVSLGLRLSLLAHDIGFLLEKFLIDDAYYAYSLARNIAFGDGIVFNRGVPTNGFQPLYVFLLVPVFYLTYPLGINVPVYVSLVGLALCSVLTGVFVYLVGARLAGRTAGLFGAFLWLFNPQVVFDSLLGLETPIQVLVLSVLTWYVVELDDHTALNRRQALVIGFLSGIAVLARLDSIFVIGALYLSLGVSHLRRWSDNGNVTAYIRSVRPLLTSGTVAAVVVLPWFGWSLLGVGRLTPVSGAATRQLRRPFTFEKSIVTLDRTLGLAKEVTPLALLPNQITAVIGTDVLLVVGTAVAVGVLAAFARERLLATVSALGFLLVGTFVYHAFYVFYIFGYRPWYAPFTHFVVTLLVAFTVDTLLDIATTSGWIRLPRARTVGYGLVVTVYLVAFVSGGVYLYDRGVAPQERVKWEAATYVDRELSADARIGSFNTGVLQYYTTSHDVVNLDGVVNPEAFQAMRRGEIETYIQDRDVEYLVDTPETYDTYLSERGCELQTVERFEMRNRWSSLFSKAVETRHIVYELVRVCPGRRGDTAGRIVRTSANGS